MYKGELLFFDFCAGIGGGRLGLERGAGAICVGYSETDQEAVKTYKVLHNVHDEINYGDLTQIEIRTLPDFDLMIAGFPCQPFSIVGKRKGLNDERGQIIYSLIRILKEKRPSYFLFENVKGLVNHDHGRTIQAIIQALKDIGYCTEYKVLSSSSSGIPQMRERVYFIGVFEDKSKERRKFQWYEEKPMLHLQNFLIDPNGVIVDLENESFQRYLNNKYNRGKYNREFLKELISEDYLILDTRQTDLRLYRGVVPTLRAGRHGILYTKNRQLHRLSSLEALLLQGFEKESSINVSQDISQNNLLTQAGNAMTVTVVELLARQLIGSLE